MLFRGKRAPDMTEHLSGSASQRLKMLLHI